MEILKAHTILTHDTRTILHKAACMVTLYKARQVVGEAAARVQDMTASCALENKCNCGTKVDYTKEMVYHIVLAGIKESSLEARCASQPHSHALRI